MRFRILLAGLAVCLLFAQDRGKDRNRRGKPDPNKLPEVNVELRIERDAGTIKVDGKAKNVGVKPLEGIVLFFEFLEPGGRMISRMTTVAAEDAIQPGKEAEFLTQTPDQVRAVHVRLDAEDSKGRYLRLAKAGPFTIE